MLYQELLIHLLSNIPQDTTELKLEIGNYEFVDPEGKKVLYRPGIRYQGKGRHHGGFSGRLSTRGPFEAVFDGDTFARKRAMRLANAASEHYKRKHATVEIKFG